MSGSKKYFWALMAVCIGIMVFSVAYSGNAADLYEPGPSQYQVYHESYTWSDAQTGTVVATAPTTEGETIVLDALIFTTGGENSILFGTADGTGLMATHYWENAGGMILDPNFRIVSLAGASETVGTDICVTTGTAQSVGMDIWYHFE